MPPRLWERLWERLFHAHENARRELDGREPLPDLPYTEEDREIDRRFLEEDIPAYRARRGWQTEEARAVLNYWQRNTEERLNALTGAGSGPRGVCRMPLCVEGEGDFYTVEEEAARVLQS